MRSPIERAQVVAWSGLREARTVLLESRVHVLQSQIALGVVGEPHTADVERLANKVADALECCEAILFWLGGGEHEAQR
jgi:hypothetical protein